MPVGSVLAKESISPSIKKKKARLGPLFFIKKCKQVRFQKQTIGYTLAYNQTAKS
jgi:hypothetical protein